jgi:hypothetical protein
MPFTISHAAAVLPFSRPLARWRLLSATIIGSMVPDFGFLMPWRPPRVETHSLMGLLWFCLPVGLLSFWVFQGLIKGPILAVLPNSAYVRWRHLDTAADMRSLKQWLLAALGVLCGAVSHLVWDGFTHEGARGIRMIPVLDDPIVDFGGHHLGGARLLQDLSSLFGLALVMAIILYGLRGRVSRNEIPRRSLGLGERCAWLAGYLLGAVFFTGFFLSLRHPSAADGRTYGVWIGYSAIAMLRGSTASLLLVSLCLKMRLRAT